MLYRQYHSQRDGGSGAGEAVLLRAPYLKLELGSIHVAHFDEVPWFDGLQGMCARRKMGAQGLEAIRSRNKKQNGDFASG